MKHHPSCRPFDTGFYRVCDQCGEKESANEELAVIQAAENCVILRRMIDPTDKRRQEICPEELLARALDRLKSIREGK